MDNTRFRLPSSLGRGFVDREKEMAAVHKALKNSGALAIAGMEGIGKTQLAIEYAHRHLQDYPGGVFWAGLTEAGSDPLRILHQWAEACGEETKSDHNLHSQVSGALARRADKYGPLLLVVDDVRPQWKETARLFLEMARSVGASLLLTTPDQKLATIEWGLDVYPLPTLSLKWSEELLITSMGPQVSYSRAAVRRLARELEGLPLALELAGRLVKFYASKPGWKMDELTKEFVAQEQKITTAFNLSYETLQTRQQKLFRILGLLTPTWIDTPHMAVLMGWEKKETTDALDGLVAASLLQWVAHPEEVRYTMHSLIHKFAASLTSEPDTPPRRSTKNVSPQSLLRQILVNSFSEEELKSLCQDLGVNYDSLPAQGLEGKARELVSYLERRERLGTLITRGRQLRATAPWGEAARLLGVLVDRQALRAELADNVAWALENHACSPMLAAECLLMLGVDKVPKQTLQATVDALCAVMMDRAADESARRQAALLLTRLGWPAETVSADILLTYLDLVHRLVEAPDHLKKLSKTIVDTLATSPGDTRQQAQLYTYRAVMEGQLDNLKLAQKQYEEATKRLEQLASEGLPEDNLLLARIHLGSGNIFARQAEEATSPAAQARLWGKAERAYQKAVRLADRYGQDAELCIITRGELGFARMMQQKWQEAEDCCQQAKKFLAKIGDQQAHLFSQAHTLDVESNLYWYKAQTASTPDEAAAAYLAAYQRAQEGIAALAPLDESEQLAVLHLLAAKSLYKLHDCENCPVPDPLVQACEHWETAQRIARHLGLQKLDPEATELLQALCEELES